MNFTGTYCLSDKSIQHYCSFKYFKLYHPKEANYYEYHQNEIYHCFSTARCTQMDDYDMIKS